MHNDVSYTEVSLGGDHGKNSYMLLAIVLIRHADDRELHMLEIKIGKKMRRKTPSSLWKNCY